MSLFIVTLIVRLAPNLALHQRCPLFFVQSISFVHRSWFISQRFALSRSDVDTARRLFELNCSLWGLRLVAASASLHERTDGLCHTAGQEVVARVSENRPSPPAFHLYYKFLPIWFLYQ